MKIFSLGDNALTIDFGNEISVELNERVLTLAQIFDKNSFAGFVEIVPAYSSLTVFYDVFKVRKNFPKFSTAFEAVKNFVENNLESLDKLEKAESRVVEIPVCFDREFALDLDFVATENNLAKQEAVEIFLGRTYHVFMLGFLPGFAYMGEVDRRIATPRKTSPRLKVPKGSVGIAGTQTGVYPLASPGGWQIIGKTNVELFTPNAKKPTFLQAGDTVKFYSQNQWA
ncbi:MAG: 5-oxoprolinase subunit PxpB [Acidobacteriota bacterium]|jgi:inhibitor of KinA|nr:5-oxoprolinase subunit PxpB [Acidobacteriota bacterium]MDQ3373791.1 5-oxoprolinase subunit PxpB [Acidobacteriota bacterium]